MPLNILFLSHKFYPDIGGIETISEILANYFSNAGHRVHMLTWSLDQSQRNFAFTVIRSPSISKLLKEHAWADFVFENNPSLRLSWPALLYNRPSIVVLQTWISDRSRKLSFSTRVKYLWLKRTSRVVAISNAVRTECWPSATVIANSYNADHFKVLSSNERTKDFVFIGRLVSDKGADIAIKALHLLRTQPVSKEILPKQFSLTIIGDGPDMDSLKELVNGLKLQDCVQFTGNLRGQDIANCLNQHRFLLVPSIWKEPFGIVALEGMACGCLPIVSDGGGLTDAVGDAGITFSRGNVDALVKSIRNILSDSKLEQQLREAATKQLRAHHPDKISQQYLDLINLVLVN